MRLEVQAIWTFRLVLKTGYVLDLKETFYVLSFSKNLVSILRFFKIILVFCLKIILLVSSIKKSFISGGVLINGLYEIHLEPTFEYNYLALRGDYGIAEYYK